MKQQAFREGATDIGFKKYSQNYYPFVLASIWLAYVRTDILDFVSSMG